MNKPKPITSKPSKANIGKLSPAAADRIRAKVTKILGAKKSSAGAAY